MRPHPGGSDALPAPIKPRSRKSSMDHAAAPSSNGPTTFFMRSEQEMEQSLAASQSTQSIRRPRDSTYGVQSLADTLEAAFGAESTLASNKPERRSSAGSHGRHAARSASHGSSADSAKSPESPMASPLRTLKRKLSSRTASMPLTPVNDMLSPLPTSATPSTPTSVSLHSLKLSDEGSLLDDTGSQVITSSGEEDDDVDTQQGASSSFPQLVMPSIQMPTRRPFTTKGKNMGKLKVMVAGQAGIGKTSLIRSIVQSCEDIVHVDALSPSQSLSQPSPRRPKPRRRQTGQGATLRLTELHASTKPYPHWWTDVEETRVLRRRKSSSDTVLERNICFVDTPGYLEGNSDEEDMNVVIEYLESLLQQTASVTSMEDGEIIGVVSGNGGILVDVILYLLPPSKEITKDVEFMQRLSALTNVIPVIAKSETLSGQELISLKASILARLQATSVRPFLFGKPLDDALLAVQGLDIVYPLATPTTALRTVEPKEPNQFPFPTPTHPYAISSNHGTDNDVMDASLLMSPDYVQPLVPSELSSLIEQVFDPESIAWLRHAAAKKFLAWRRRTPLLGDSFIRHGLPQPRSPATASVGLAGTMMNPSTASSVFSAASPSGVLVPRTTSPFYSNLQSPLLSSIAGSPTDPTAFSLTPYINTNPQASDIRVAKWATDLHKSLRNERDRFEELQRNERAKWLLDRVGEEVKAGTITAADGAPRAEWAVVRHANDPPRGQRYRGAGLDAKDPLGLCGFGDEVRRRGVVLVQILGGMSVLGAVGLAVVRVCGVEMPEGGVWGWLVGGAGE
ncbi:Septin-domain-containing protein [Boeremia exigua]|uniref:Septin-domain-containing protein n=1 Tax=Boeremia exigua TaxID=749465 RepID=UPI001E8E91D5|nr:Septin-domain-containing protein [Boeremia exigua]KAH6620463.1 Septin-domain-containing protein [Boeremia exigua]